MEEAATAIRALEESFEALESAVEEREYSLIEPLLQKQRDLLRSLAATDPQTQELARRGYELAHWGITMIKIQRSGYARSLAAVLNAKRIDCQYAAGEAPHADLVSVTL